MNPQIKQLWIEALESGTIPQGTSFLGYVDGRRCCLGVLCDIAAKHGVIPEPKLSSPSVDYENVLTYGQVGDRSAHALPLAVQEWADITSSNPNIVDPKNRKNNFGDFVMSLAEMNDQVDTFIEIADVIREQL